MGCASSGTAVRPLRGDEDETGSKHGDRGDSAVSKVTADSGVVVESREVPGLPGAVPRQLPPLTLVREGETDAGSASLQQSGTTRDRKKSCEILEELLSQGIITVQTREGGSRGGEAYSIMLNDREEVSQRRPARLESLKARKEPRLPSREEFDEKIRLAEERRKSREEEFKTRLRAKSARRVRGPAPTFDAEEAEAAAAVTPVEPLQSPSTPDPTPAPPLYSRLERGAAEGGESVREAGGDGRESRKEKIGEGGDIGQGEEEEELTQVEALRVGHLLSASGELESDFSFQHAQDKKEVF